ncbi:unnamed protein product [Clonostachys rosea]|uniref:TauD/TfdA-like domain-containing protein n=1 Tax=Bionectria ochroleuca TaxID=29856 RepID=A0ABY6UNX3_BIOOC|nr:unnamed protein product [Clonostachys rosea]
MSITFEPFDVPGGRTYYGNVLPFGLQVKNSTNGAPPVADSVAALREYSASGKIQELLDQHGAVLIRGFGHPSAETFAELVGAAEQARGYHPHEQIGLAGKRNEVAKNVWTANEGSPLVRFYQHNEYSRYTRFPSNIHFYCVKKAPEGGRSPIAHSANVFEKVQAEIPDLVKEVYNRGLGMKMIFRAPGSEGLHNGFNWAGKFSFGQEILPEDDEATRKAKVEKQVHRLTSDFKWNDDGSLELTQHIPGIELSRYIHNILQHQLTGAIAVGLRRDPANGRPTWFNGLVGRHGITRDIGALDPPHIGRDGMTYLPCVYGDETPIPREYLDKLIEVIDKEEIHVPLEEGDLLLVDNFQVSHGREPWAGERQILVSMWEGPTPIGVY